MIFYSHENKTQFHIERFAIRKRYPLRTEPPPVGHYREYPPGGLGNLIGDSQQAFLFCLPSGHPYASTLIDM